MREDIRETLKQQKMTQEMASWTQELREQGGHRRLLRPRADQPLPPVVKTIWKKPAAKPEPKTPPTAKKPPGAR